MQEQPVTPEPATDAATLSDDERRKVRELLRECTPEGVELALSILDTLDAMSADWQATFDHEVLAALVQSWSVVIWDGLYGRLPARRKDLFAAFRFAFRQRLSVCLADEAAVFHRVRALHLLARQIGERLIIQNVLGHGSRVLGEVKEHARTARHGSWRVCHYLRLVVTVGARDAALCRTAAACVSDSPARSKMWASAFSNVIKSSLGPWLGAWRGSRQQRRKDSSDRGGRCVPHAWRGSRQQRRKDSSGRRGRGLPHAW